MLSCILLSAGPLAAAPVGAVCTQLGHSLQHLSVLFAVTATALAAAPGCATCSQPGDPPQHLLVLFAVNQDICCSTFCAACNQLAHLLQHFFVLFAVRLTFACICKLHLLAQLPILLCCLRSTASLCVVWPCTHLRFYARPEHSSNSNLSSALHEEQVTYATSRLPF